MMALALLTDVEIASTDPVLKMAAFFSGETIVPFLFKQIIVTGLRGRKALIELNFTFCKIFGDLKICHIRLLI